MSTRVPLTPAQPPQDPVTPSTDDLDVELLDAVPSPVSLFGRAVRAKGRKEISPEDLPTRRLVVPDASWTTRELSAWARLCGFRLGGPVSSPWLHVRTFGLQMKLMTAQDFPLAVLGLVHISNRWRMHAPVAPDAAPTFTVWADAVSEHPKGALVTVAARAEVAGELVWEGWSDYLARGVTVSGQGGAVPRDEAGEITASELPERARWRFAADAGREYAGVAGDANPIHLSALTAKAFGFKRAIAHGMFTAARAVAALEPHVPERHQIDVTFGKPLFLPSTVTFRAQSLGAGAGAGDQGARDFAVTAKDPQIVHMTGRVQAL